MPGALRKTMLFLGLSEADPEGDYAADAALEHYEDEYVEEYDVPPAAEVATTAAVTPLPSASLRRITTVHPRSYNDAKVIGESFRAGTPVILNLTDMSDADAKRLVDFSAGLVFGLRGAIERVTTKVFLLSPASVEVSSETSEPEATGARFFNQS